MHDIRSEPRQPADVDGRNAGVVRTGGDTSESVVRRERLPELNTDGIAVGIIAAETAAHFIEYRGRDQVGP